MTCFPRPGCRRPPGRRSARCTRPVFAAGSECRYRLGPRETPPYKGRTRSSRSRWGRCAAGSSAGTFKRQVLDRRARATYRPRSRGPTAHDSCNSPAGAGPGGNRSGSAARPQSGSAGSTRRTGSESSSRSARGSKAFRLGRSQPLTGATGWEPAASLLVLAIGSGYQGADRRVAWSSPSRSPTNRTGKGSGLCWRPVVHVGARRSGHDDVEGLSVTAREGEPLLGDPVGQHQDAGCLDVECADR
jgi:hypothetical protein